MPVALGAVLGLVVGLTGVGGGLLTGPLLLLFYGMQPADAVGSALVFNVIVKALAAVQHLLRRNINFKILGRLALGGVPGAALGAFGLERLSGPKETAWALTVIGFIVLCASAWSLLRSNAPRPSHASGSRWIPPMAFLIGAEVGFSSAGAGALGTVLLFRTTQLGPLDVLGTDLAFGLAVSATGSLVHVSSGSWSPGPLVGMLIGGVPAVLAGVALARRMHAPILRKIVLGWAVLIGLLVLRRGAGDLFHF